jgi:secreted trypsin-like serine protease
MKKINTLAYILLTTASLSACNSGATSGTQATTQNNPAKSTLVQNGSPVSDPRLNSMVPLIYIQVSSTSGAICTGTLIDNQTILTASHCVLDMAAKASNTDYKASDVTQPSNITILFSNDPTMPVDINDQTSIDNSIRYTVSKIYVHKDAFRGAQVLANDAGFNITNNADLNDLAILKLSTKVPTSDYAYPNLATANPKIGQTETIAGYGVDLGSGVKIQDPESGQSGLLRSASTKVSNLEANGLLIDMGANITQNSSSYYTKICQGDSGGPDFIDNGTNLTITGVHSFGDGSDCGSPNTPATSVSVAAYYDWINGGYVSYHI